MIDKTNNPTIVPNETTTLLAPLDVEPEPLVVEPEPPVNYQTIKER